MMRRILLPFWVLCLLSSVAIAQVKVKVKEPFFTRTSQKHTLNDSTKEVQHWTVVTINLPNRRSLGFTGRDSMNVLFFIFGKLYSEAEAAANFDKSMFSDPGLRSGTGIVEQYKLEGAGYKKYDWLFWIGEPPPLSEKEILFREINAKYTGKVVVGVVKEYAFDNYNHRESGFILESGNVLFKVDITRNELGRLMKRIVPGDVLIITINWAGIEGNTGIPKIIPRTLTKDGEILIQNGSVQI